jgi:hypothetical protein
LAEVVRFDDAKLTKKERQQLAPKDRGLNVEAISASADGKILYIGLRNPRPRANALVVPLHNAQAVIEKSDSPVFGKPLFWNFHGLGIRSLEYSSFHKTYFTLAGSHDETPGFVLYRWSGRIDDPPKVVQGVGIQNDFTPEALICFSRSERLLILSDDGSLPVRINHASECLQGRLNDDGTCPNKFLRDPNKKTFRAAWILP